MGKQAVIVVVARRLSLSERTIPLLLPFVSSELLKFTRTKSKSETLSAAFYCCWSWQLSILCHVLSTCQHSCLTPQHLVNSRFLRLNEKFCVSLCLLFQVSPTLQEDMNNFGFGSSTLCGMFCGRGLHGDLRGAISLIPSKTCIE